MLVKGKFLRKAYKDPMTKDGKWRFLRQGEGDRADPGELGRLADAAHARARRAPGALGGGPRSAGFVGVASLSTDESLRLFNGRSATASGSSSAGSRASSGKPAVRPGPRPAPARA